MSWTILKDVNALPKSNKRRAVDIADTENASSPGLQQMSIQESLQEAGKQGVNQALADWVYETGILFQRLQVSLTRGCCMLGL